MRLTVTRKHHTHAGKTYRVGDEFDGSEKLLTAFSDRLAPVDTQVKTMPAPQEPKKRGRPKKAEMNADASNSE